MYLFQKDIYEMVKFFIYKKQNNFMNKEMKMLNGKILVTQPFFT